MSQLTYGGYPLLWDHNQQVQEFLDSQQREDETTIFPEAISRNTWQTNPVRQDNRVGIPRVNWPAPPPVRLNQLYWPCTGASRWAFGMFLIGPESFQGISNLDCNSGAWLEYNTPTSPTEGRINGTDNTLTRFWMWPLTAKRLAGCRASVSGIPLDEWNILLLVDNRYWWQFLNVGPISDELTSEDSNCVESCTATWETLIAYLMGRTGATWTSDAVAAGYTTPDCREFNRPRENLATVIDAAAESIGCHLVALADGSFRIERPELAASKTSANFASRKDQTAGTYCYRRGRRELPARLEVVYRTLRCYSPECDSSEYVETVALSDNCGPVGTVKTIHVPGYADMGCDCENSTPDNAASLSALAIQIAADYYASIAEVYDVTYNSPQPWIPSGFDDCIIIKSGVELKDKDDAVVEQDQRSADDADPLLWAMVMPQYKRIHQTRIQSLPLNVGVDCQLHYLPVTVFDDEMINFELTEDLCRGDCAEAKVLSTCCGQDLADSGITVDICDTANLICSNRFYGASASSVGDCEVTTACGCVPSGTNGIARFNPKACRFEVVSLEICDEDTRYWIEALECIKPGETATGRLLRRGSGGALEEVCASVSVDNSDCLVLAVTGETFPVEGADCDGGTWHPSTTFGLTRRVRFEQQVCCGNIGAATVLEMIPSATSSEGEPDTCQWNATDCEIDVCNQVGYPIMCGDGLDHEDAEVRFEPSACMFIATKSYRPMWVEAELTDALCGDDDDASLGNLTFYPTCEDWTETITAITSEMNPYDLYGCNGDKVLMQWRPDNDPCDCIWIVVQVEEHQRDVQLDMRGTSTCTGSSPDEELTACSIEYKRTRISFHQCDCSEPDWQSAIETEVIDVVIDANGIQTTDCYPGSSSGGNSTAVAQLIRRKICVLKGCDYPEQEIIDAFEFVAESFVTFLEDDGSCLNATVVTALVAAVCDESVEEIFCTTDCSAISS